MLVQHRCVDVLFRASSSESDDAHSVIATARGVFNSKGGMLESKETGRLKYNVI